MERNGTLMRVALEFYLDRGSIPTPHLHIVMPYFPLRILKHTFSRASNNEFKRRTRAILP